MGLLHVQVTPSPSKIYILYYLVLRGGFMTCDPPPPRPYMRVLDVRFNPLYFIISGMCPQHSNPNFTLNPSTACFLWQQASSISSHYPTHPAPSILILYPPQLALAVVEMISFTNSFPPLHYVKKKWNWKIRQNMVLTPAPFFHEI